MVNYEDHGKMTMNYVYHTIVYHCAIMLLDNYEHHVYHCCSSKDGEHQGKKMVNMTANMMLNMMVNITMLK